MAVQHKLSTGAAVFYYTYSDHLGNVVALSTTSGTFVAGSLARHDPFGNYRTTPATTINPTLTDQGFTGHGAMSSSPTTPAASRRRMWG